MSVLPKHEYKVLLSACLSRGERVKFEATQHPGTVHVLKPGTRNEARYCPRMYVWYVMKSLHGYRLLS